MEQLNRVKTIMIAKKPRVLEFIRDFDKLRHGRVTPSQFFRAFMSAGLTFTDEEMEIMTKLYSVDDKLDYVKALKELQEPIQVSKQTAGFQALASQSFVNRIKSQTQLDELIARLQKGASSHPVIGKQFFLDFDIMRDGIINGSNFARGLSTMFEAFFRSYPTEDEIIMLVKRFSCKRPNQIDKVLMNPKEISVAFNLQTETVDYRAFCEVIGAAKELRDDDVEYKPSNDPAFAKKTFKPELSPDQLINKVQLANKKFRFDFKSFFQARDKRNLGQVNLKDFVAGFCDAVADLKRVGINADQILTVGKQFSNLVFKNNSKGVRSEEVDLDQSMVDFKAFLDRVLKNEGVESEQIQGRSYTCQQRLIKFFIEHPVALRQEFEVYDKRRSGKVTGQQFKQVLCQFVPVRAPEAEAADGSTKISIDNRELSEIVETYTVGLTGESDISPDKLIGSGVLVDYLAFITDTSPENDFIPDKERKQRQAAIIELVIPDPETVYFKIADQLQVKHQKLSDCLNQGEPGSTKWNRTSFGRLSVRFVQRALSNLLTVSMTNEELTAVAVECEDDTGIKMSQLLEGKFIELGKVDKVLGVTEQQLEVYLDQAEISVQKLQEKVKIQVEKWQPNRCTGYSYSSGRDIRQTVNLSASQNLANSFKDTDNMNVTLNAVKHMGDLEHDHLDHLIKVFGPEQQLVLKGQTYYLQDIVNAAQEKPSNIDVQVQNASKAILQMYYEIHVNRSQPVVFFQEFDKLKSGYVTTDQFSRAFMLAGLNKVIQHFPKSFASLVAIYVEKQPGRFQNMVDYAFMLRELGKPPVVDIIQKSNVKKAPYNTLVVEKQQKDSEEDHLASIEGIIEFLTPLCMKFRPKLREYFWDFDKRRAGVCEQGKLGAALSLMKVSLNARQIKTLNEKYESKRPGFEGSFEWRNFIEDLEKSIGMRL
ncbi:Conserved_hypothetical protein [Hexamita inflata]|uniref:EF-hand domain-containing protein n=1 Tax=Hexamita inflata TaxID=28002 RepID=A0AA86QDH4_9EUKA|nr:Conserved hypothetical protein [Hexamita inflata]